MPAASVVLLVHPETASELPRSALSVAAQEFGDWQLCIVHNSDPDIVAAVADLTAGDSRIVGAATVGEAVIASDAPVVCWLETGARYPAGYLAAVVSAMADPEVRCTVAARLLEYGPRFMHTARIPPDGAAEPCRSQVAVRNQVAAAPFTEVLAGPGRCDLPDLAVATRFGELPEPHHGAAVTVIVELSDASPPLSVKPQLVELLAAGLPVVVASAGAARLAGRLALGSFLQQRGAALVSAGAPAAARAAALRRVTTPLVAFVPAGWEIEPGTLTALAVLLAERGAAAVAPVARDAGGSVLAAGLIWADERTLPQRLLEGHPVADVAGRLITVPAPHPEGLVMRTPDALAGVASATVPAPWWPLAALARAGRQGPVLIDGRYDIAIPRFTPASATGHGRGARKPPAEPLAQRVAAAVPPHAVAISQAALADCGWAVVGIDTAAGRPWRVLVSRPAIRTEQVPQRRWALKIGAPPGRRGDSWGDVFFAEDLARALRALGNDVVVDRDGSAGRAAGYLDRVVLNLRGYQQVQRSPGTVHLLWIISHPDLVTPEEMRGYDRVYAASASWPAEVSRGHGIAVEPLLQATDPQRFHPDVATPDSGPDLLFVGNSKNQYRPIVADCRAVGLRPTVIGRGWEKFLPADEIAALEVANADLPAAYRSAGIVLNDHWGDMAGYGFLNNRLFDAVACGARIVTDDVRGLAEVFGDAVQVYRTQEDLARICDRQHRDVFGTDEQRRATAARIAAEHSFAARARRLMDDAAQIPILPQ